MLPSSATMLRRLDTDPKRGTASPTRRYLRPFVLNTSVTHMDLWDKQEPSVCLRGAWQDGEGSEQLFYMCGWMLRVETLWEAKYLENIWNNHFQAWQWKERVRESSAAQASMWLDAGGGLGVLVGELQRDNSVNVLMHLYGWKRIILVNRAWSNIRYFPPAVLKWKEKGTEQRGCFQWFG